jgi:4-amino-4-deoxy-L-arabinose transferase-like glycosyltransferase
MGAVEQAVIPRTPSNPLRDRVWIAAALLYAVAALALCYAAEPLDHGYTRYATVAFEMLHSGDWVAPRLDGRLYVDKPPLAMWTIASAMALANSTASVTQHAPNLVALLLSVLFLQRLGVRIFGRRDAGWIAAGLYLSALLPYAMLRDKRIDPLFTALLIGALDFLHAALASRPGSRARLGRWLGAGALLAAATLTKGPLAIAFFVAIAVASAAWTRRLSALATRDALAAAALCLAIIALWPLAMWHDGGLAAWLHRLAERDLVSRFAGPLHYVWNLPLRLAPWALLLPALALALGPLLRTETGAALRFPVTWFGVVLALLHVTSAKHTRYLLPALPAAALLFVALWITPATGAAAALPAHVRRLRDGGLAVLLALALLAGIAMPIVPLWIPEARMLWPALAIGAALAATGAGVALRRMRAGADAVAVLARALVVVLVLEASFDLLRSARHLGNVDLPAAQIALAEVRAGKPTLMWQLRGDTRNAVLLATRASLVQGDTTEDARRFAATHAAGFVVARPRDFEALRAEPGLVVGKPTPLRLAKKDLVVATLRSAAPDAAVPAPAPQP